MKHFPVFLLLLFLLLAPLTAEAEMTAGYPGRLTLDTECIFSSLKNGGWGFGASYEKMVYHRLSVLGGLSHSTLLSKETNEPNLTTVAVSLGGYCYPLGDRLDHFFLGAKMSTSFLQYLDGENQNKAITYLIPEIGWKQNLLDYFTAILSYRYRILLDGNRIFSENSNSKTSGELYFGVKLRIQNIIRLISGKKRTS